MKQNIKIVIMFLVILCIFVGAIIGISANRQSEEISIVTTNFPAYDFARAVAGDTAKIKMLLKPGAEMHDYEPSPQDIIDIKNSKLFIFTGGESDEWVHDILGHIDTDKTKIIKMMDYVEAEEEEIIEGMESDDSYAADKDNNVKPDSKTESDHHHSESEVEHETEEEKEYDEHIWTSLKNASMIINGIKDELVKISPENQSSYLENAKNYTDSLAKLDLDFQRIVDEGNRKLIVFGDRFPLRYFVDDYGLEYYAAFPGCSEQTEASSSTIAYLVDKIKSNNIPVVFKTEMSSGDIARTIASETGAKVLTFNTVHTVSADDFKEGRTYVNIMTDNLKVLEEALK